jgi:FkbM family methyltransferase
MIRRLISKATTNMPWLFYKLKKLDLAMHYYFNLQYENDFLFFKKIANQHQNLCIIDVGANIGQSAIGFANLFSSSNIFSFEANSDLEGYLSFCRQMIGERFIYHMTGLSSASTKQTLYVPRRGKVHIYGEASVDRNAFSDPEVEIRIGKYHVVETEVELIEFDSLFLKPDIVKIDVQGHELSVLQGMQTTIDECSPIFLIERSPSQLEINKFLQEKGYKIFLPSKNNKILVPYDSKLETINMFGIPIDSNSKKRLVDCLPLQHDSHGFL